MKAQLEKDIAAAARGYSEHILSNISSHGSHEPVICPAPQHKSKNSLDNLLTVSQVAEKLLISKSAVYKWKGQGILRAAPLSRKALRFREKDIQDFIDSKLTSSKDHIKRSKPKKSSTPGDSISKSEIIGLIKNAQKEVLSNA